MEYINKGVAANVVNFNQLIDSFIAAGKTHYKALDEVERNGIRTLLSGEQSHRCAFCMQLQTRGETVEHVIPQGIKLHDFINAYRKGNFQPQFVHQDSYNRTPQAGFYPHTLAYGNMVMACGACNHAKWDRVIKPSFFDNPPAIRYQDDGIAVYSPDDLEETMRAHLNGSTFTKFRALWSAIKRTGITVAQVRACNNIVARRNLLRQAEPQMRGDLRNMYRCEPNRFIKNKAWEMLCSFDWFWGWY
jgi:5-methylcytosine-specific restriction endonuclease McrA